MLNLEWLPPDEADGRMLVEVTEVVRTPEAFQHSRGDAAEVDPLEAEQPRLSRSRCLQSIVIRKPVRLGRAGVGRRRDWGRIPIGS